MSWYKYKNMILYFILNILIIKWLCLYASRICLFIKFLSVACLKLRLGTVKANWCIARWLGKYKILMLFSCINEPDSKRFWIASDPWMSRWLNHQTYH
jgi:hypothetical protein